jgi:hypothetical protein
MMPFQLIGCILNFALIISWQTIFTASGAALEKLGIKKAGVKTPAQTNF